MNTNRKLSAAAALLSALGATNAIGQVSSWANTVSGNWNDTTKWDTLSFPSSPGHSAVLGLGSPYSVTLNTNPNIDELSITNPSVVLSLSAGLTLGLNGPTSLNNGIIYINPNNSSANGVLSINGNVDLGGTGQIRMQTGSDNSQIAGFGTLTNGANHTIRGVGRISAPTVNNGIIEADIVVALSGNDLDILSPITNSNILSAASASNLDLVGVAIDQSGGGMIFAANGGAVNASSVGSVLGGTIDRAGTGQFNILSGATTTLTDVTNNGFIDVQANGTASIAGAGLVNNGTVALNQQNSSANAIVSYSASGDLSGAGELVMRTGGDNSQLNTALGVTITQASTHAISGVGQLNASMINNGTISADSSIAFSGNELDLQTNDKVNNGDMTAEAGSFLDIVSIEIDQLGGGDLIANGGTIRLGGTSTIQGGVFTAHSGGLLDNTSGSSALLSGMVLNGPMNIAGGSTVRVDADGMVNNGIIQINPQNSSADAVLVWTETGIIDGNGEIRLLNGASSDSQVNTDPAQTLTQTASHTIRGVGQINAGLINNGEVKSDLSVALSGNALVLRANDKVNNNLMVAGAGSFLDIIGITLDQSGGGMIVADGGTVRLGAGPTIESGEFLALSGGLLDNTLGSTSLLSGMTLNGPLNIAGGSTVQVDADGMVNNGVIQINPQNSSADAVLVMTESASINGTGEIRLLNGSAFDSQINTDPTFNLTHGADHTIRGVGMINAAMTNLGVMSSDVSIALSGNALVLRTGDKVNANLMSAEAGSFLDIQGVTLTQTGPGSLEANSGQIRFSSGATLSGGPIHATGTGAYQITGPTTFSNVTANAPGSIAGGQTLTVSSPSLVNHNVLTVNPTWSSADAVVEYPVDGTITGTGEIVLFGGGLDSQVAGPGTVTNASGHTISGRGTVSAPFINQGTLNPGLSGVGTLGASSGVTLAPSSILNIELAGNNSADRLAVTGTANLGGTLNVTMAGAAVTTLNFDYTILTATNVVGTFATENIIVNGNLITRIVYEPTQVRIITRCIADTNLDGAVTPADFTAWVAAFNAMNEVADQNLDGNITPADFSAWIANFNAGCP